MGANAANGQGRFFAAPWGGVLWVITALTNALLLGVMIFIGAQPNRGAERPWVLTLIGLMLLVGPLFRVSGYRVSPGLLEVWRPWWSNRVRLSGAVSGERLSGRSLGGMRLFGNGGFWSFTGWYWSSRLGRYRCFLNDPRRAVVVRTGAGCVVVSPDDPEAFLQELAAQGGRPGAA